MLSAGKRDRWITVQVGASTQNPDSGEPSWAYSTYFQCWAERKDISGREALRAQQLIAEVDVIYRIPYPHGKPVTPHEKYRVIDQGVTYNVTKTPELGRR